MVSVRGAVLVWAAVAAACSSNNSVEQLPKWGLVVDGKDWLQPGQAKCVLFAQDNTRGQKTYQKTVEITNVSGGDKPVCITSVKWAPSTSNTQLKVEKLSFQKDAANCPNAEAAIPRGQSIFVRVTYAPDATALPDGTGTLSITPGEVVNAGLYGTGKTQKICFGVDVNAPTLKLKDSELHFQDATCAAPQTRCLRWCNGGKSGLTFKSAKLDVASKAFQIVNSPACSNGAGQNGNACVPNQGDVIPGVGESGNEDGNAQHQVCVQFDPCASDASSLPNVLVQTDDPTQPEVSVPISTSSETGSFSISCNNPSGLQGFDFTNQPDGTEQCCTVLVADNGAAFTVIGLEMEAAQPNGDPQPAKDVYTPTIQVPKGQVVSLPRAVPAGKSGELCVKVKKPADNSGTPPAWLAVAYKQPGVKSPFRLPVIGTSPAKPLVQLGPGSGSCLGMQAAKGQSATALAVLANQTLSTVNVAAACVTAPSALAVPGVCNTGKLAVDYTVQLLDAAGTPGNANVGYPLAGLATRRYQVTFAPKDTKQDHAANLMVEYCNGTAQGAQCLGDDGKPTANEVLNLSLCALSDIPAGQTQPKLSGLAVQGEATHGKTVTIAGTLDNAVYDTQNYQWVITERPAKSGAWLDTPITTSPAIDFIPDQPGKYVLSVIGQLYSSNDPTKQAWTPSASVAVDVK
jgi:hypothetical protein